MQMQANPHTDIQGILFITTEATNHSCTYGVRQAIPEDRVELVINPPTNMTFRLTQPEQIVHSASNSTRPTLALS
ncbi:hypothetical protein N7540_000526 [Penicillium herquei]|nr:hypothetical protein N7540_000526 [Penicillium herquei]